VEDIGQLVAGLEQFERAHRMPAVVVRDSVDRLPRDLSARTKKYLKSSGYGDKRAR
jgi:hypothetical protein